MANKILFGIIGALLALLVFIFFVMIGTSAVGFQNVAIVELGLSAVGSFVAAKKFAKDEMIRTLSFGAFIGSIVYLLLILIGKTVLFSLLGGITN